MRSRSGTLTALATLAAVVLVGGCSSSSDGDADASAGSGTATTSAGPSFSAKAGSEEFCKVLQDQTALAMQGTANDLKTDPEALKAFIARAKELNTQLLAVSPASIKPDVELSLSISALAQEAATDPSKRAELAEKVKNPAITEANQRLSQFASDACTLTPEATASASAS